MSKPYRFWPEMMPFRKNGTPVVGTMGSSLRHVIIMEAETLTRLIRDHPSLATAQFEMAEYTDATLAPTPGARRAREEGDTP